MQLTRLTLMFGLVPSMPPAVDQPWVDSTAASSQWDVSLEKLLTRTYRPNATEQAPETESTTDRISTENLIVQSPGSSLPTYSCPGLYFPLSPRPWSVFRSVPGPKTMEFSVPWAPFCRLLGQYADSWRASPIQILTHSFRINLYGTAHIPMESSLWELFHSAGKWTRA